MKILSFSPSVQCYNSVICGHRLSELKPRALAIPLLIFSRWILRKMGRCNKLLKQKHHLTWFSLPFSWGHVSTQQITRRLTVSQEKKTPPYAQQLNGPPVFTDGWSASPNPKAQHLLNYYWMLSIGPRLSIGFTAMLFCHGSLLRPGLCSQPIRSGRIFPIAKRGYTPEEWPAPLGCLWARHSTHALMFGCLSIKTMSLISLFSSVWINIHGWNC